MNKCSGWSYLIYMIFFRDEVLIQCLCSPLWDLVKKIANALLMVDYIAKIYADCLYRFALIDRQAGFRADTCAR